MVVETGYTEKFWREVARRVALHLWVKQKLTFGRAEINSVEGSIITALKDVYGDTAFIELLPYLSECYSKENLKEIEGHELHIGR